VERFYFHVDDGQSFPDLVGTLLPDVRTARVEAIRTGGEMLRDAASYWDGTEWRMDMTDEAGTTLFRLRFSARIVPAAA
jgi:hypothetical protein